MGWRGEGRRVRNVVVLVGGGESCLYFRTMAIRERAAPYNREGRVVSA
jgi:hypothetical protein